VVTPGPHRQLRHGPNRDGQPANLLAIPGVSLYRPGMSTTSPLKSPLRNLVPAGVIAGPLMLSSDSYIPAGVGAIALAFSLVWMLRVIGELRAELDGLKAGD